MLTKKNLFFIDSSYIYYFFNKTRVNLRVRGEIVVIPMQILALPERKEKAFKTKGISTLDELLMYLPRRYDDLSQPKTVNQIIDGEFASMFGMVVKVSEYEKVITFTCKDTLGQFFRVSFFGNRKMFYFRKQMLRVGTWFLFGGKFKRDPERGWVSIISPPYVELNKDGVARIVPVYKKIHKDVSHDDLNQSIQKALSIHDIGDFLEPELFHRWSTGLLPGFEYPLIHRSKAFRSVHSPTSLAEMEQGKYRLAFDELFKLSFQLHNETPSQPKGEPVVLSSLEHSRNFIRNLPFQLTPGQHEVLRDMVATIKANEPLQALVQGDVGCGKTMVAIIMMLTAVENGYQSALMAPTNVLALQHSLEIQKTLGDLGYEVVLLSGDMKAKDKREAIKKIQSGEANFVVGTHALLSEKVQFHNLGMVVLDEEHRFGVRQREVLKEKVMAAGINFISMTATPIPRTLASSLYNNNIKTFSIKSLPAGRQPIVTTWVQDREAFIEPMLAELQKGRQAYLICPLIEDNEKLEGVMGIEECENWLRSDPRTQHLRVGFVHGKCDVAEIVGQFKNQELDLLIATTVIEVGVNVPNATFIGILNADRFGIAQLHQLRGRVGRGSHASCCYLQAENPTPVGARKLQAMTESTDGFYLSQVDLQMRGAGNLVGDTQSGFENTFMLLLKYPQLFEAIQEEMTEIFKTPERLIHYQTLFNGYY